MSPAVERFGLPLTAVALCAVLAVLVRDTLPRLTARGALDAAESASAAHQPAQALDALGLDKPTDDDTRDIEVAWSGAHGDRRAAIITESLTALLGGNEALRQVGPHRMGGTTRPAAEYAVANATVTCVVDIPQFVRRGVRAVVVRRDGASLGATAVADDAKSVPVAVMLVPGVDRAAIEMDLRLTLPMNHVVVVPLVRGLCVVRASRGPTMKLLVAGADARDLGTPDTRPVRTPVKAALSIALADPLGLCCMNWRVGTQTCHETRVDGAPVTATVPLPPELTARAHAPTHVEVMGENSLGVQTRAEFDLVVSDPSHDPIDSVTIGGKPVTRGGEVWVTGAPVIVGFTLAPDDDGADLVAQWDERFALPIRTGIAGFVCASPVVVDGRYTFSLARGKHAFFAVTVVVDSVAPAVTVKLGAITNGDAVEPGSPPLRVDSGAIISVRVQDDRGLDAGDVVIDFADAEVPVDTTVLTPPGTLDRMFRVVKPGLATLRVAAKSKAGLATALAPYLFKVVEPFALVSLRINGQPFPSPTGQFLTSDMRLHVEATTTGPLPGALSFSLIAGDRHWGDWPLNPASGGLWVADIAVPDSAPPQSSVIAYLNAGATIPERGEIILDHQPPTVTVRDIALTTGADGVQAAVIDAGQRVVLEVRDPFGVDANGVYVEHATVIGIDDQPGLAVVVLAPDVNDPAPTLVRARDLAGNAARFVCRFTARPTSGPATRPATEGPASAPAQSPSAPLAPVDTRPATAAPAVPADAPTLLVVPGRPEFGRANRVFAGPGVAAFPPFYMLEHELSMAEWRTFVDDARGDDSFWTALFGKVAGPRQATRAQQLVAENPGRTDTDPVGGITSDLARAWVRRMTHANADRGTWRVPTAAEWRLAAGRALYPDAVFPTTGDYPDGRQISDRGEGGASFGDVPGRPFRSGIVRAPGAFGLVNMPGSMFEWCVDPQGHVRLIGGCTGSSREECRLDAPLRASGEVLESACGLRAVFVPAVH